MIKQKEGINLISRTVLIIGYSPYLMRLHKIDIGPETVSVKAIR